MSKNYFPAIVLLIISGIILQHRLSLKNDIAIYCLLLFTAIAFISYYFLRLKFISSIFISISFVLIGAVLLSFNESEAEYPFENTKITNAIVFGEVKNASLIFDDKFTLKLRCDSIITAQHKYKTDINLLVKIYADSSGYNNIYDSLNVGQIVRLKGTLYKPKGQWNPFEFDYYQYLQGKGISAILNVYKSTNIEIINNSINLFGYFNSIRRVIDKTIHELYSDNTSGLLRGLLLADRSEINYTIKEKFVNAGVIHVLAVSGLHVGFILLIFLFLFGRFNIYIKYICTVVALLFFMILTGMPVSVVRSSLMAFIAIMSLLSGRKYNLTNSIFLAALIILLYQPKQLFEPGFQLSFSAVLSIIYGYPILSKVIIKFIKNKFIRGLALFLAVSVTAQIGTLPFTIYYFHKISLVALFANLLVIPIIGLILGIGLLSLAVYPLSVWVANIYALPNDILSHLLFYFINLIGSAEESYIKITQFSTYDSVIYYAALLAIFFIIKSGIALKTKAILSLLILPLACVLIPLDNIEYIKKNELNLVAINIGQGDAFLISFPNGENAMIDFGPNTKYFDSGAMISVPLLKNMGIKEIKYALVSHLDNDHYGGFYSISKNIKVDSVFLPWRIRHSRNREVFEKYLKSNGIPFGYYHKNTIKLGEAVINVLNDTTIQRFKYLSRNDNSGLIKIKYGNKTILFTGDLGVQAERIYANLYGKALRSDLLKISHHGSITGTSELWLKTVKPEIAIISVGEHNKFHHPSPKILERLMNHSIKLFRTDKRGAIILRTDGRIWKQVNWRNNWRITRINN